jgi:hypothetical protein
MHIKRRGSLVSKKTWNGLLLCIISALMLLGDCCWGQDNNSNEVAFVEMEGGYVPTVTRPNTISMNGSWFDTSVNGIAAYWYLQTDTNYTMSVGNTYLYNNYLVPDTCDDVYQVVAGVEVENN